jgi:hypothetical protein
MKARIEGIARGPAYIDVEEIDGQPPAEITIRSDVSVRFGNWRPDELTIPLAGVVDGEAVYRSQGD